MLVCELKGLDQTQCLLHRAPDWEVIDGDLSQDALVVDDKQTPEIERAAHARAIFPMNVPVGGSVVKVLGRVSIWAQYNHLYTIIYTFTILSPARKGKAGLNYCKAYCRVIFPHHRTYL